MPQYVNKWEPHSLNEPFWREVLVGRKIVDIKLDPTGIHSLILDSGEEIFLSEAVNRSGRLFIKVDIDNEIVEGGRMSLSDGRPDTLNIEGA